MLELHVSLMRVWHLLVKLSWVITPPEASPTKSSSASSIIPSSRSFASVTAILLHQMIIVVEGAHPPSSSLIHCSTWVLLLFTSCSTSACLLLPKSIPKVATSEASWGSWLRREG